MKSTKQIIADNLLFATIILMIFAYYFLASFTTLATQNEHIISDIKTQLGMAFALMIGYKWGTSQSSKDKDATIKTAIENNASPSTTSPIVGEAQQVNVSQTPETNGV